MTKLIIDADTGSDDAVALLMAYRNLPEDKILGITVVAGNVPLKQGLINTSYVNELCEVQIPIYKGAEKPLERNYIEVHDSDESTKIALSYGNDSTSAQNVHGVDGLVILVLSHKTIKLKIHPHKIFISKFWKNRKKLKL